MADDEAAARKRVDDLRTFEGAYRDALRGHLTHLLRELNHGDFITEDQRWQVSEARRVLAWWDAERSDAVGMIDREGVLSDQVRTLLAVVDELAPGG